ncbi:MAG: biosynthetic-type acetolactate synthase large subunit [Dehalococcoidia bacterium]|nr:biosynthetic-type acetolactate synthase large subunit [Dehalococcoidia bacterium]
MKTNGAHILCQSLIKEGVEVIFGFPGGAVIPLYDALLQYPQLRHVLVRHEQAAAHAADGYARVTGKVGVCIATSGPGATNLITGVATAHLDSSPIIAITGQVSRPFIGKDAFQEADVTGITLPITKHNYLVMRASDMTNTVKEAFHLARTGRPGPILLDIPKDVFTEEASFNYPEKVSLPGYNPPFHGDPSQIEKAAKLISESNKPVILAGRGVIISKAYDELKELAEKAQIPVITTLLGISSFPESHVLSFGMLGMHGMTYANWATSDSDLIIAIGMRFDDRATGNLEGFAPNARIIHIDIDPAEIDKNVKADIPIVGDCKDILKSLNRQISTQLHIDWIRQIEHWQDEHPATAIKETHKLLPQYVIRKIYEATHGDAIIVTGVGQHQMWAAQHFWYDKPGNFVSSGGLGTMGFGLPASIGAKIGCQDETVWMIDGDGSFQMNMQELATVAHDNVAVKMAILNNGFLGMVRQWQELFHGKRYMATPISCPDLMKIAEAYDIPAMRVTEKDGVTPSINKAMNHSGPYLIEFRVEPEENVYPMVAPGAAISEVTEDPNMPVTAVSNTSTSNC